MRRILLVFLVLAVLPTVALAGTPLYTGSVSIPTTGQLTLLSGGTGCALITLGILSPGACPTGTTGIVAGTNITLTGSNPYTINCPLCFQTTGGTVSGATTFSALATFSAATTSQQYQIGTAASAPYAYEFPDASARQVGLGYNCGTVNGITAAEFSVDVATLGCLVAVDASGNIGTLGQVTATQFNISSLRAYKKDIAPLHLNALSILERTCWSSYRYRRSFIGNATGPHIGFIADCAPSILSGAAHDHFDLEAVSTVDSLAILQLSARVARLQIALFFVAGALVLVTFLLSAAFVFREKAR